VLTVQILTKNNAQTIGATLDSVSGLEARIIVGDLGSTDGTQEICVKSGAEVREIRDSKRNEARNRLAKMVGFGPHFAIEPWEILSGGQFLRKFKGKARYARVLSGKTVTHEIRLWDGQPKFINPVFERLENINAQKSDVLLYSRGGINLTEALESIMAWKNAEPLSSTPNYYHACVLFSLSRYEEFISIAEHYLRTDREETLAKIMMRYYHAIVSLVHRRQYRPALQNINLCLCARPLMAEFWCLMGDVYYHLLRNFEAAKEFYGNAIVMGSRRTEDFEPMDIDKYRSYPEKMTLSCTKLLENKAEFVQMRRR
jgi:glycosyltransferase involved in cell wall biosynthesis